VVEEVEGELVLGEHDESGVDGFVGDCEIEYGLVGSDDGFGDEVVVFEIVLEGCDFRPVGQVHTVASPAHQC